MASTHIGHLAHYSAKRYIGLLPAITVFGQKQINLISSKARNKVLLTHQNYVL